MLQVSFVYTFSQRADHLYDIGIHLIALLNILMLRY